MSKLITGEIAISDLSIVEEAVVALGYTPMKQDAHSRQFRVTDTDATYHPFITVYDTGKLEYDNWMGGKYDDLYSAEHRAGQADTVTQRVVGRFKQEVAKISLERHLKASKASWRVEKRADGSQVLYVRK